jgi:phosphoribosyl-ATP pyrophosphohydrolase/phosphoribosyl-AMP cyclohydrolase
MAVETDEIAWDSRGLVPAIIRNAFDGTVLMLGYMNAESFRLTVETKQVHFWSRSRKEIWRKGATSGNTMALVSVDLDCDDDTLLVDVVPEGPACHTGSVSCFGDGGAVGGISELWQTILSRVSEPKKGSYTCELIAQGTDATARKVVEEAGEVLIAAKNHQVGGEAERVVSESADLIYHLLVLLAERGIDLSSVEQELDHRANP